MLFRFLRIIQKPLGIAERKEEERMEDNATLEEQDIVDAQPLQVFCISLCL